MPMHKRGMNKLMEECGELVTIIAKKSSYPTGPHPSRSIGDQIDRLIQEEMGDVLAAIRFVTNSLLLDEIAIQERATAKFELFLAWDRDDKEP